MIANCDRCGRRRRGPDPIAADGTCYRCRPGPVPDRQWMDQAACAGRDPSWWDARTPAAAGDALEVCSGCPVAGPCAAYADAIGAGSGVWAGRVRTPDDVAPPAPYPRRATA